MVEPQAQAAPEEAAEADLDFEPSGTYRSAKDAISKLLGEAPAAPGPSRAIPARAPAPSPWTWRPPWTPWKTP